MKVNSVIFKNPEDDHLIDLGYLGTILREDLTVQIMQRNHYFMVGDVLAYDIKQHYFVKAIALNTMQSEICGVVSSVIDLDNFTLIVKGAIETPQYQYPEGSTLWLSEVTPGKLNSVRPTKTFREVATQVSPGVIDVNLKMGITMGSYREPSGPLEYYTKEELDEIILNLM